MARRRPFGVMAHRSRTLLPFALVALAVVLLAVPGRPVGTGIGVRAAGTGWTLVVDPAGSDTTGDGSAAKPWRTIQKAASQVQPGDLVLINPGTYSGRSRSTTAVPPPPLSPSRPTEPA